MKKLLGVLVAMALFCIYRPLIASAGDIAGMITDAQGNPVPGLLISALTAGQQQYASAISGSDGSFRMDGLPSGEYLLKLDPRGTGFQGQTVVTNVGQAGLTVSWKVSTSSPAFAMAQPGVIASTRPASNTVQTTPNSDPCNCGQGKGSGKGCENGCKSDKD